MSGSRINEARDFLNSLMDSPIKLPFDPILLPALFASMSDSSRASMRDIAQLVSQSQGLAVKVLSVANSACYGLRNSVKTLELAVQVLGILDLRSLAVMFGTSSAIPQKALPKNFPRQELWEHQMRTAKIGRLITLLIAREDPAAPNLPDPESVYAAGILHDLGKIVLAHRRPDDWFNISWIMDSKGIPMSQAEDEYWGIDHGAIGGIILQHWNLPELLSGMVSWHHYPFFAAEHHFAVRILAAANILAEAALTPGDKLSEQELALPGKGLPPDFLGMLPGYEGLFGKHYSEFVAVKGDRHTCAFVGAL